MTIDPAIDITYSEHAITMLAERGIAGEWVEMTLAAPESWNAIRNTLTGLEHFGPYRSATAGCCAWYMFSSGQLVA